METPLKKIKPFLYLPLIALAVLAGSYFRPADNYELQTLDLRFHLRPKPAATDKIVLIDIGNDTLKNLGQWPIDRNYHALLIKALSGAHTKAVIFDIFFSEPTKHDDGLEGAMREAKNVYLPFVFDLGHKKNSLFAFADGYNAKNLARFSAAAKGEGHINIFPDIDGKFRRIPALINYNGAWYPYISFLATCDYLGIPPNSVRIAAGKYISCNGIKIPLDDSSNMIINFSGRWEEAYRHYSYYDIVQSYLAPEAGQSPILDLGIFRDKVCVVGLTATGTVDLHPSPLESLYPGFGIHAEVFNSMLNRRFISRAPKEANILILIILGLLVTIATLKTKPIKGLVVLILIELILTCAGILIFNLSGIWIDLFYPTMVLALLYLSLTLYKYVAEWKKRLIMENELGIAKKIQESFLPKALPDIAGLDISASMLTAKQVGGDLYDFVEFGGRKVGVMIGDVSGKGIPASLFMAMVAGAFKSFARTDAAPNEVLAALNNKLIRESSSGLFVTMFYAIFDLKSNTMVYANAGHLPALYLRKGEGIKFLDTSDGTPLGLIEGNYSSGRVDMAKDDVIVFYTDGVTEAMNPKREMYGKERLSLVAEKNRLSSSRTALAAIEKDVKKFEPKDGQHDDITVITVKIT